MVDHGNGIPNLLYARLAQLGECFPYKEDVGGSSPSAGTLLRIGAFVTNQGYGKSAV